MWKKIHAVILFLLGTATQAQTDTCGVEIIGFISSDQLCLLTNTEKRDPFPDLYERSVVVDKAIIGKYREVHDPTVVDLLRNNEAYIYYGDCYDILYDIFRLLKGNDTLLSVIQESHPVRYLEGQDGRFFRVVEQNMDYIVHHPIMVDSCYYYQDFNTDCFLLVSAPYRVCFSRQPLLNFGDGIIYDFWLEPESSKKVTVVIPLLCNEN